jgi:hypothetical protein
MFQRLQVVGIIDQDGNPATINGYLKIESEGYMPLSVDLLSPVDPAGYRISMAHNHIQNGDMMADPDMEIRIYPGMRAAEALTYQQDSLGIYQEVYPEPGMVDTKLKLQLNRFLAKWLNNLIEQGFRVKT